MFRSRHEFCTGHRIDREAISARDCRQSNEYTGRGFLSILQGARVRETLLPTPTWLLRPLVGGLYPSFYLHFGEPVCFFVLIIAFVYRIRIPRAGLAPVGVKNRSFTFIYNL